MLTIMNIKKIASAMPGIFSKVVDKNTWDNEYNSGRWDYLSAEQGENNNSVIAGIINRMPERSSVYDIGCGEGYLSKIIDDTNYTGIDLSEAAIKTAKEHNFNQSRFFACCADEFIKNVGSRKGFGVIVFNEILYYLSDPLKTIREYMKAFPGDTIIISMYNGIRPRLIWPRLNYHFDWSEEYTIKNKSHKWTIKTIRS